MRYLALSVLAGLALAAPRPQGLDFDAIDELPDVVSIDANVPTTIAVAPTAAVAAALVVDVSTDPLPEATAAATPVEKRDLVERATRTPCTALPTASNYYGVDLSSADAFRNDPIIKKVSTEAVTPIHYKRNFFAQTKGTQNSAYLLQTTAMTSYDPQQCSVLCDNYVSARKGSCQGFNIYFHRDPTQDADVAAGCPNPPATSFILCVLYGAKVDVDTLKNNGQFRAKFETAYAGSNGYSKRPPFQLDGFTGPEDLGDAAINAPLTCDGVNTYMGVKMIQNPTFEPALCAEICLAQNKYNAAHPPKNGPTRFCNFFNTYLVSVNDEPQAQACAMYTTYWDPSYADNRVQYRGDDKYTKTYSFSYYLGDSKVLPPTCPADNGCDGPCLFKKN